MAPQAKPLCPFESYRNSMQKPSVNVSQAFTGPHLHEGSSQFPGLNVDLNFQMTTTASLQLSPSGKTPGVLRAGAKYHVQGNPSLDHQILLKHQICLKSCF